MFCFCRPVDSFFLCPLFIIYTRTSIVIRCRGNPLFFEMLPLTRTREGNIFPLQKPRLYVHTHTHTCTPPTQKVPPPPPSPPVTTAQARFRDTNRQDLSATLLVLYPSPPPSLSLVSLLFSVFHSQTLYPQCQNEVTSPLRIVSGHARRDAACIGRGAHEGTCNFLELGYRD